MKKTLSIILMLIMAFAVIGNAAARPDMHRNCSGDALDDAVAVAFIPSGDGENAIGYYEDEEANAGPESFAVNDGNVYVLDSVKTRIVAVEDGAARYTLSGYEHNDSGHWQECSICHYETTCSSHSCNNSYSWNNQYHWHECLICGHECQKTYHTWQAYGTKYMCTVCGMLTDGPVIIDQ